MRIPISFRDTFDSVIAKFAIAYAEQTERDHARRVGTIYAGRLPAEVPEAASLTVENLPYLHKDPPIEIRRVGE